MGWVIWSHFGSYLLMILLHSIFISLTKEGGREIVEGVPTFNLLPRGIVKIYLLVEGVAIAAMGHCF